jgi:hypothetical protein
MLQDFENLYSHFLTNVAKFHRGSSGELTGLAADEFFTRQDDSPGDAISVLGLTSPPRKQS